MHSWFSSPCCAPQATQSAQMLHACLASVYGLRRASPHNSHTAHPYQESCRCVGNGGKPANPAGRRIQASFWRRSRPPAHSPAPFQLNFIERAISTLLLALALASRSSSVTSFLFLNPRGDKVWQEWQGTLVRCHFSDLTKILVYLVAYQPGFYPRPTARASAMRKSNRAPPPSATITPVHSTLSQMERAVQKCS